MNCNYKTLVILFSGGAAFGVFCVGLVWLVASPSTNDEPNLPRNLTALSQQEKDDFRNKYDVFFFDNDGTLTSLGIPIPGTREAIASLNKSGKVVYVYTDNSLFSRKTSGKILKKAYPELNEKNVMTSGWLLSQYLVKTGFNGTLYVIGNITGVIEDLNVAGLRTTYDITSCEGNKGNLEMTDMKDFLNVKFDQDVRGVVVSPDFGFNYYKLFKATNYLKDPSVGFYVTSMVINGISEPVLAPAVGAIAVSLQAAAGRERPISCDKTSPAAVEYTHSLGYDMKRSLFVGDAINSDMICGSNSGMDTLLVLTGISTLADVQSARRNGETREIPTYYAHSVEDLGELFSSHQQS